MTQTIDAALFKSMIMSGAALLEQNKQHINDLNVFPVPDGDTGTNMSLTLNSGVAALKNGNFQTVGEQADAVAAALLRGARGNSGVILSLLFRGISKALKGRETIGTYEFASALTEGVSVAYKAVMRPTEGTILTVSRLAADAAMEYAETGDDFEPMMERLLQVGNQALAQTTEQNPVLKKAGVVDAGAKGYLFIMQGMLSAIEGTPVVAQESESMEQARAQFEAFSDEDITYTYCTEFIVSRESLRDADSLRDFLSGIGDSIVVVDDEEIIKVHVHTDMPGAVLTQALTYGSLVSVKIENMRLQHTQMIEQSQDEQQSASSEVNKRYGVVAVCAGEGMKHVFDNLGVDAVVTGGQTMNPSTEDILNAVESVPAETVFVLPNNKNIIMAAQQCQPISSKKVVVVPTKTVPQGVSAMVNFDQELSEEELSEVMGEACESVHTALITYAARDSEFDGTSIHAGEYLALLENSLLASSKDLALLITEVSAALQDFDPEVLTIFYGQDVKDTAAEAVEAKFSADFPDADVTLIDGGQPVYYYMISAE